jgi:hypothetical protein
MSKNAKDKKAPDLEKLYASITSEDAKPKIITDFDPAEVVAEAAIIRELNDSILGKVRFGALTLKELRSISKFDDVNDRSYHMIHLMLQKAYPNLTFEQFEAMPFEKVARLSQLLNKHISGFLQKPT